MSFPSPGSTERAWLSVARDMDIIAGADGFVALPSLTLVLPLLGVPFPGSIGSPHTVVPSRRA